MCDLYLVVVTWVTNPKQWTGKTRRFYLLTLYFHDIFTENWRNLIRTRTRSDSSSTGGCRQTQVEYPACSKDTLLHKVCWNFRIINTWFSVSFLLPRCFFSWKTICVIMSRINLKEIIQALRPNTFISLPQSSSLKRLGNNKISGINLEYFDMMGPEGTWHYQAPSELCARHFRACIALKCSCTRIWNSKRSCGRLGWKQTGF